MENNDLQKLGYSMPAEWEKHTGVWLAWPHLDESFEGHLDGIEKAYVKIIQSLYKYEKVRLLVLPGELEEKVKGILADNDINIGLIEIIPCVYADVWTRDFAPIYIKNREGAAACVNFKYDAYGNKFESLLGDDKVFQKIQDKLGCEMFQSDFVLEGGAIESNGQGVFMTTRQCLLENRNKGMSKEQNEDILKSMLGARQVIWLNQGLVNDHTDGHIDEVARFVAPNKVLLAWEEDESNPNYGILKENYDILQNNKMLNGEGLEIVKLPLPHMNYSDGTQAPASYANFYIGNQVVLASQFNDENDAKAIEILQSCFPDKEIIGIDCTDLIYGGGAMHCITQQIPE